MQNFINAKVEFISLFKYSKACTRDHKYTQNLIHHPPELINVYSDAKVDGMNKYLLKRK